MSRARSIIHHIEQQKKYEHEPVKNELNYLDEYERKSIERYLDKLEEDKEKTEDQKTHEKYLRYIKRKSAAVEIEIKGRKEEKYKPGLQFEGTLKTLTAKYKVIDEIYKHMSLGQICKYYSTKEEPSKIYRVKDNKLVYDEEKQECYE
jgi:hypothetical protein